MSYYNGNGRYQVVYDAMLTDLRNNPDLVETANGGTLFHLDRLYRACLAGDYTHLDYEDSKDFLYFSTIPAPIARNDVLAVTVREYPSLETFERLLDNVLEILVKTWDEHG